MATEIFGQVDPAGLVLGSLSVLQGMPDSRGGVQFYSGVATYTPTSGVVAASAIEIPAIRVEVVSAGMGILAPLDAGIAQFNLHANVGQTPTGPYIANARFKVEQETGFDEIGLEVSLEPLPTPVGSWNAPWIQYDSLVNIKIDGYDDAKMTFVTSVDHTGSVHCTQPEFLYGRAEIDYGYQPKLVIKYFSSEHG